MICSPVKTVDGKIIGVIQVLNKKKGRFTKENLNFVNAIATQAAVSIQSPDGCLLFFRFALASGASSARAQLRMPLGGDNVGAVSQDAARLRHRQFHITFALPGTSCSILLFL